MQMTMPNSPLCRSRGLRACALALAMLSLSAISHADTPSGYNTYVIHTYGDPNLAHVVQAELAMRSGGTATMYQDRLIIQATPSDYAHVTRLVSQIDRAPESLTLSLATAPSVEALETHNQVNVGIQSGLWVNGRYQSQHNSTNASHAYRVRTLSGRDASIGQSTLVGLLTRHHHQLGSGLRLYIDTTWLTLTDGFKATPRLLPNGQVLIRLHQSSRQGQHLDTTITVTRGQWVKVGDLSMSDQHTQVQAGYRRSQRQVSLPVWIRID